MPDMDSPNPSFQTLLDIMKRLRAENGCPWDREQTRETLKQYLIEEAYEVIEAIDSGTPARIMEELGDLLFQIIFHVEIARENNEFTMNDVIQGIRDKMVRRHPHVFGNVNVKDSEEVLENWEKIKGTEKNNHSRESIFDGIPKTLPSLQRAQRIQGRAAKSGFDWDRTEDVVRKLDEEIKEFKTSICKGEKGDVENEFGDILFTLVNLSRFLRANPEEALRKTTNKFVSRFKFIEQELKRQNRDLAGATLDEMEELWEKAKNRNNLDDS